MNRSHKIKTTIFLVLFLVAIFSIFVVFRESRRGILKVVFLDVGQGDAIYIESPNGNQMLIDGGPDKSVLRELSKVMPFYDRSIDVVLATHPDQDHVGGLPDVLNKYEVNIFMEPGVLGESSSYKKLENMLNENNNPTSQKLRGTRKILAKRGVGVDFGDGAILQILFPDRDPSGIDTNDASIVAKLVYGNSSFLFTGDSPKKIENYLVSLDQSQEQALTSFSEKQKCQGQPLNCPGPKGLPLTLGSDILKVGHHGSKTSTGANFLPAVSPKYAIISVGKNNRYGHPNKETLDILNNFGAKVLRTDEQGRIIFKGDGVSLKTKSQK